MKRGLGWMLAMGLGGALVVGCQGQSAAPEVGRFNEPIHQKNQPPIGSAGENGQGGSGEAGVAMDPNWQQHPSNEGRVRQEDRGPYWINRPQAVPHERQNAPLWVGSGSDTSRKMAIEQLESE